MVFFHEMFAVSKDGPASAPPVEVVYQGVCVCVCVRLRVVKMAVLGRWP